MAPFGKLIKHWRSLRGVSQLDLAMQLSMSPRHVSFLETGRSRPTAPTVHRLAEGLEVPLAQRNALFRAAGLPDGYPERDLEDPALGPFNQVIEQLLTRHDPYPGYVLDRHYRVVQANRAARLLFPVDVANPLELLMNPQTGRALLENWEEVAWSMLRRLRRDSAADPELGEMTLAAERWLANVPPPPPSSELVACMRIRIGDQVLRTIGTIARFDAALDPTADALRIELLFPADPETAAFFERLAATA